MKGKREGAHAEDTSFTKYGNALGDYEDVVAAVGKYVAGLKSGNIDELEQAFHNDATMYGFDKGALLGGSIDNLYTFVRNHGPAPQLRTHIDVLDITPTTAVARVTLEYDVPGTNYTEYTTDYHSLIKIDGKWVIIAKLFHFYNQHKG